MAKLHRAARSKQSVERLFDKAPKKSHEIIADNRSHELFFGVVGPVGAGSTRAIDSLDRACQSAGYKTIRIKASALIKDWAWANGGTVPPEERKTLKYVSILQNLGDEMRMQDSSAVARIAIIEIAKKRAEQTKQLYRPGQAIIPDANKRAYLIDSIRHPAEINLLRRTYGGAFALIGVVCEEKERERRILGKYFTKPEQLNPQNRDAVKAFMKRDADDAEKKHGQHVNDAFYESDFFVDNTEADEADGRQFLDEDFGRLIDIITHDKLIRPTIEETAMHHAHSARVRSACLSRQVGAALVDDDGTVISTGVNEVPKGGGGVYGEDFRAQSHSDDRCAFRASPFCSSNREQNKIIDDLIGALPELESTPDKEALRSAIRKTRIGQLIEFSRAVHAEMDALLSASREGVSTYGTRLFVTTFPCHYCARHIVSAGVTEVHYIEPYPKSLAVQLHQDSIETDREAWKKTNSASELAGGESERTAHTRKVLFTPFVGVAPRLYIRAFEKKWRLKNKDSGDYEPRPPEWGDEWAPFTLAYPELEAVLTREK